MATSTKESMAFAKAEKESRKDRTIDHIVLDHIQCFMNEISTEEAKPTHYLVAWNTHSPREVAPNDLIRSQHCQKSSPRYPPPSFEPFTLGVQKRKKQARGIELVEPHDDHCSNVENPPKKRKMDHDACPCSDKDRDELFLDGQPVLVSRLGGAPSSSTPLKFPTTSFTEKRLRKASRETRRRMSITTPYVPSTSNAAESEHIAESIEEFAVWDQPSVSKPYDNSWEEPAGPSPKIDPMYRLMSEGPQDEYIPLNAWFTTVEQPNGVPPSKLTLLMLSQKGGKARRKYSYQDRCATETYTKGRAFEAMDIDPPFSHLPSDTFTGVLQADSSERGNSLPPKPELESPSPASDSKTYRKMPGREPWYHTPNPIKVPKIIISHCKENDLETTLGNRVFTINDELLRPPKLGRYSRIDIAHETATAGKRERRRERRQREEEQKKHTETLKLWSDMSGARQQIEETERQQARKEDSICRSNLRRQREAAERVDAEGQDWRNEMLRASSSRSPRPIRRKPVSSGSDADTGKQVVFLSPNETDTTKEVVTPIPGLIYHPQPQPQPPHHAQEERETTPATSTSTDTSKIAILPSRPSQRHPQHRFGERWHHPKDDTDTETETPLPRTIMEAVREQDRQAKRERKAKKELKRLQKKGAWCPPHSGEPGRDWNGRRWVEVRRR